MYYTHPGCRTSIFGENRVYCIRDFTVHLRVHNMSMWVHLHVHSMSMCVLLRVHSMWVLLCVHNMSLWVHLHVHNMSMWVHLCVHNMSDICTSPCTQYVNVGTSPCTQHIKYGYFSVILLIRSSCTCWNYLDTRFTPNLKPTTCKCIHLVIMHGIGHFQSLDKDGGHTIRSATAVNAMFYRTRVIDDRSFTLWK